NVHLDHAQGERIALLHDLARVINALVRQFGDMDQPLDFRRIDQLGERAELRQLGELPLHKLADIVLNRHGIPGVGSLTLHAQADALAIRVYADALNPHFIADLSSSRGWVTCCHDSSVRCTSLSAPPISIKAPKSTRLTTRPVRISPTFKSLIR